MRQVIIMCIISGLSLPAMAQILAPDFICVRGDTLQWQPATNTCGPFRAYEIFFSPDQQGPYVLLARITDPSQLFYYHPNPGADHWFYYLQSDHDCPGQPVRQSDTLDNRAPEKPEFVNVTVENGGVRLNWYTSPSPDVVATIIYRNSSIPLDTVFGGNTYFDPNADPETQSETYILVHSDRCDNTSLFSNPHSTLLLAASVSACEQSVSLEWNAYQNWQNGVDRYEIWVEHNAAAAVLAGSVSASTTQYVFENAMDGEDYCFFVTAVESNTGNTSSSNSICLQPDLVRPVRHLQVKNINVTPSGDIEVTWIWNVDAELDMAFLIGNWDDNDALTISGLTISDPLLAENTYRYSDALAGQRHWYFQIETRDRCDTVVRTAIARPIFLSGSPQTDRSNVLQWKPLEVPDATVFEYIIYKEIDGQYVSIGSVSAADREFVDPFDPDQPLKSGACYFVAARAIFSRADGTSEEIISNSNVICISQATEIYVPNAFAPRGRNQVFKPVTAFTDFSEYQMQIFSRWGQVVFESNDIDLGWNGKRDGKDVPAGVYTYLIRLKQPDGKSVEKAGTVMLIR